jgi:uncharacterized protein (TIGR00369 family)
MKVTPELLEALNRNTLYRTIGIRVEHAENGKASSRLHPNPEVCWPFRGQPHGGILYTTMDTTMACAVLTELEPGLSCSTVDLTLHFTAPAKGDYFICNARTTHRTSRLSFVRAEILSPENHLLALGQAAFRIIKNDLSLPS